MEAGLVRYTKRLDGGGGYGGGEGGGGDGGGGYGGGGLSCKNESS